MEDQLEFRILGPLEVERGNPVPVGTGREAALLGALLLRPNETVSTDSLIGALWDEGPPASAREMIRIYVARLRKDLRRAGAGDALATVSGGYAINVGDGTLDASRFEQLRAEGLAASAAGDAQRAVTTLAQATALWRGATWRTSSYSATHMRRSGASKSYGLRPSKPASTASSSLGRAKSLSPSSEL